MASIEELQAKIAQLEATVNDLNSRIEENEQRKYRGKIEVMSAEVVDSNPYRSLLSSLLFSLPFPPPWC